jgi:hypothetical protein
MPTDVPTAEREAQIVGFNATLDSADGTPIIWNVRGERLLN